MHIPILAALDNEWTLLAENSAANGRFQLWKEQYPALASIDDLTGLLAVANDRSDLAAADAALAALAQQAPADALAAQVLLHALLPGLKSILRSCRSCQGVFSAASSSRLPFKPCLNARPFRKGNADQPSSLWTRPPTTSTAASTIS